MAESHKGVSPYERQEHSDENHAKKVNNYIWDGANWIREEASSGGGLATVTILSMPTTSITGQVSVVGLPTVSIGNTVPVTGTFYQATQPVSGTVSVTGLPTVSVAALPSVSGRVEVTALPTVSVAALPSISGQVSKFRGSTSVATCISGATTSLTLKASNTSRIKAVIVNNSTNNLYVKEGAAASSTNYTYLLGDGDAVIIDDYVGQIDGIWNGVNGSAQVSETT